MATVTYYFNAYDEGGLEWAYSPELMVDGDTGTDAYDNVGSHQLLTDNTCGGTDLGKITKVEIRLHGQITDDEVEVTPIFTGGDGDVHYSNSVIHKWTNYMDITSDTNAPATWSWANVVSLDCDVRNTG